MTELSPHPLDSVVDLSAAERLDLATAARAAARTAVGTARPDSSIDLVELAAAVEDGALAAYVDGRMSGLCHDGALELFRDAARAVCAAWPVRASGAG